MSNFLTDLPGDASDRSSLRCAVRCLFDRDRDPEPLLLHGFAFERDRENAVETLGANDRVVTPLLPGLQVELSDVFRPPTLG